MAAAALSVCVFAGCNLNQSPYVTSIEKSETAGLVDWYTITYSDGTTSRFSVTNGKDGTDGKDGTNAQDVTAMDVYETYKEIYGEELTYKEFCEKYLTVDNDSMAALNSALRSCVMVYMPYIGREYGSRVHKNTVGSGVIYKMEEEYTYILTNYHVVYTDDAVGEKLISHGGVYLYGSAGKPLVTTSGNIVYGETGIECDLIGGSISYDVAILKAKTSDVLEVNSQAAPVVMSYEYNVGEETYAVGNPDDQGMSVTKGVVSVDSDIAELSLDGTVRKYRSIRTDTSITSGNSGGGLFNARGELIGLNNAGRTDITFMNYAIPASILTAVGDGLMYYNAASSSVHNTYITRLGVTVSSNNSRYVYDPATGKGAIYEQTTVIEVTENSLAELAGLSSGDILTYMTLNGKKTEITRQFKITDVLLSTRASDTLVIGYTRGGVEAETSVRVRAQDVIEVE